MYGDFEKDLKDLLNVYGKDVECNTPDYILTNYLINCLDSLKVATEQRENSYNLPEDINRRKSLITIKTGL